MTSGEGMRRQGIEGVKYITYNLHAIYASFDIMGVGGMPGGARHVAADSCINRPCHRGGFFFHFICWPKGSSSARQRKFPDSIKIY